MNVSVKVMQLLHPTIHHDVFRKALFEPTLTLREEFLRPHSSQRSQRIVSTSKKNERDLAKRMVGCLAKKVQPKYSIATWQMSLSNTLSDRLHDRLLCNTVQSINLRWRMK